MQKTFETQGPVTLDLRLTSGEVGVGPTLEGRVEIELIAHDEESQTLVDAARVELRGDRLLVDVPSKSRGFTISFFLGRQGITCNVRCPASSTLEARTKSADVTARGPLRDAAVSTASGSVELRLVERNLTVKTASGDVSADHVGASATVQTASGDVRIGFVGSTVNVDAVSGDVRIGESLGDSRVVTVSGDQDHGAVSTGNVTAQSVSGDVEIAVRRGTRVYLDCNTLSGDTSSELDMTGEPVTTGPQIEIRAKTVSGDIRITRAPAAPGTASPGQGPADSTQEVHA